MMMHAVTDIAGLNAISRTVIGNAAHAAAGMVLNRVPKLRKSKRSVGYTHVRRDTACVNEIRRRLEPACESFVFHATGTGGQSFEKLAESGFFDGVLDITTTEVADYLVGGVLPLHGRPLRRLHPARHSLCRLGRCLRHGQLRRPRHRPRPVRVPQTHVHNAHITLMRTTPEEKRPDRRLHRRACEPDAGAGALLPAAQRRLRIDAAGQPFHDTAADAALFDAIRTGWRKTRNHKLIELDLGHQRSAFAAAA